MSSTALHSANKSAPIETQPARKPRSEMGELGFTGILLQYCAAAFALLTAALVARMLHPAEYGRASVAMAYSSLIWSFATAKPGSVAIVSMVRYKDRNETVRLSSICQVSYGADLCAATAALLFVAATAKWAGAFVLHEQNLARMMTAYALSLPFQSLGGTSLAILATFSRFGKLAAFQVVEVLLTGVLSIAAVWMGWGAAGLVYASAVSAAANGCFLLLASHRELTRNHISAWWRFRAIHARRAFRELFAVVGWNYVAVTFGGLLAQLPTVLLRRWRGPQEAGFYRLACTMSVTASYVPAAVAKVAYPRLAAKGIAVTGIAAKGIESTSVNRGTEDFVQYLRSATLRIGLPVAALIAVLIPFVPSAIVFLLGSQYAAVSAALQVLLACVAVEALFFWLQGAFYSIGAVRLWTQVYCGISLLAVILFFYVTARFGCTGVAIVASVGRLTFATLMICALARYHLHSAPPTDPALQELVPRLSARL